MLRNSRIFIVSVFCFGFFWYDTAGRERRCQKQGYLQCWQSLKETCYHSFLRGTDPDMSFFLFIIQYLEVVGNVTFFSAKSSAPSNSGPLGEIDTNSGFPPWAGVMHSDIVDKTYNKRKCDGIHPRLGADVWITLRQREDLPRLHPAIVHQFLFLFFSLAFPLFLLF